MKYLKIILLAFLPVVSFGQQVPFYSNANLLPGLYNPSTVGLDHLWSANLLRRAQWVGFDGAPISNNILIDKKISDTHGVGIHAFQEQRGLSSTINIKGMYGYHLSINRKSSLDAGFSLSYISQTLNLQTGAFVQDGNDPLLSGGDLSSSSFDASFGLQYRLNDFKIGIAIPQIVGHKNNTVHYNYERSYLLHASNEYQLSYKVDLIPFAIIRYVPYAPIQYDFKAMALFSEIWWFGAGYRSDFAISFDAGVNLKAFYIGYSYDIPLKSITNYGQSHEIVLGFKKKPKMKISYDDIE